MESSAHWRRLLRTMCLAILGTSVGCASFSPQLPWKKTPDANATAVDNFESPLSLARLNERHGQVESARLVYEAVLRNDPQNALAHHRLGVIAAQRRRFTQAEEHFQRALSAGEPTAELLADAGYLAYLQDQLDEAEVKLRQALEVSPTNQTARTNLALVLGEQGRFEECLNEFRRAGDEAQAHANLAYVYATLGELDLAENEYHRALALNPKLLPAADALSQLAERRRALRPHGARPRAMETQVAVRSSPPAPAPTRLPAIDRPDPLIASVTEAPTPVPVARDRLSAATSPGAAHSVRQVSFNTTTQPATSIVSSSPAPWSQPTWTATAGTLAAPSAPTR